MSTIPQINTMDCIRTREGHKFYGKDPNIVLFYCGYSGCNLHFVSPDLLKRHIECIHQNYNQVGGKQKIMFLERNEQLTQLDDQFEKFMDQYDEDEVGALEMDDIGK